MKSTIVTMLITALLVGPTAYWIGANQDNERTRAFALLESEANIIYSTNGGVTCSNIDPVELRKIEKNLEKAESPETPQESEERRDREYRDRSHRFMLTWP